MIAWHDRPRRLAGESVNQRDFERLHGAPMQVASVLSAAGPGAVVGLFLVMCFVGLFAFAFMTFMENSHDAMPLLALAGGLLLFRIVCVALGNGGMSRRRLARIGWLGTVGCVVLAEVATGAVGNAVARPTGFNPFVSLQSATGLAIGPFASEARDTKVDAKFSRSACLSAKRSGRLESGEARDEAAAYGCRLLIGTGHMHRYCARRYRPRYSAYTTSYDNGTVCGPYLHRYYWQSGEL